MNGVRLLVVGNSPKAETICGLLRTEGIARDHRHTDVGAGAGDAVGDSGPREILVAGRPRERAAACHHRRLVGSLSFWTHGISAIGRVVITAALIMGTVFAAFILSADRIPKEFGLLLAVAILADALIVRLTLVPALLTLLREKSWYMPRWLDRLLPNLTIEPPHRSETPRLGRRPSASGVAARPQPQPSDT
jgi:F0F1-type ATP synthase membrane subunit c/vacuolar-type H+-ATPase subunit K